MVSRKTGKEPAQIEVRELTPEAIENGIEKLRRRVRDVESIDPSNDRYDDAAVHSVDLKIREAVRDLYGDASPELEDLEIHGIRLKSTWRLSKTDAEIQDMFAERIPQTVTMLEELIARLEEKREDLETAELQTPVAPASVDAAPDNSRVFVVHGRDEGAKEQVRTFLEKLGLEPVILDEQPSGGQTVIEKFEDHADVGYAVVLLTPDDAGGLTDSPGETKPRARQNVIFELGFFVGKLGKLGRARVGVLQKGDVEIMSDYQGVIYVDMDDTGGWRLQLANEIKNAGIDVDLNRLARSRVSHQSLNP